MPSRLKLTCLFILLYSSGAFAQITIRGTVTSAEDQEALPGVSVAVKGTSSGTITDIDGNYSIGVQPNDILVFTFVGFKPQEQPVNGRNTINVTLETDTYLMEEVIVMGYSSQKKAELSSSLVTLSSEQLTDVNTSDVGNMLQGKVAGVVVYNSTGQPGANAEIRIRGTGSITADADPLYVVDGIPYGTFNPNDIETITVLKDAGATALYGSAAAGGVIVVTTKSASKNQPTKVNFKTRMGQKSPLFGNYKMMHSKELFLLHKDMLSASLFKQLRPYYLLGQDFNWQDAFFSSGWQQNYYTSISGSTGKIGYFASVDYYDEEGTLINTNFDRVSTRLNLNAQLFSNLDMNIRVAYTNSHDRSASSWTTLNDAYTKMPWDNPYDVNGEIVKITSAVRPDNGKTWYSQDKWNSLHNEQYDYSKSKSYGIVADVQFNWSILPWLIFTTTNRFSQSTSKYAQFIDPRSYNPSYAKGYLLNTSTLSDSFGTTNILKANKEIGGHAINGLVGWEYSRYSNDFTSASGIGMPNGMDALNAAAIYEIGGYKIPGAGWSAFAQAQYSYINRYFATASYRVDASSTFGPERRTGYFPSAAASWLLSNEDFLKDNPAITFLKLRASYGVTGNSNIGSFRYLPTFSLNSSYQNQVGATPERSGNPYLGWETAYMAGIGLDINLWKNIELNFDLYNIENKDLLLAVPQKPSTGFFEGMENIGSVRNQGIEIQLNTKNIRRPNFTWNTMFNIGFNKNRVTETPDDEHFLLTRNMVYQEVKRGQDIYSWYMPKWIGVDPENGDPLWEKIIRDDQGNITERSSTNDYTQADPQVVGKATPKFSGGFINNLTFKGFSLNINTNFVYGNKIFNYNRLSADADGAYLGYNQMSIENSKLGWTRWKEQGDIATHPKAVMNGNKGSNNISSRYLENGGFFRIRNITLGYDLPQNLLKKVAMSNCRVYVSGDNLFTFTRFSGMDPEVSLKTTEYSLAGLYADNYPISRQVMVGVEINF
ncbi:MAG: TonB-dependent receptor [Proteiniphilum sp.]|jgi:TonB-linked SusC/RagA family outer membrane protein|uniref:SusC/RagA family TonB-linked outer membrane protein n=1 Tax=Proteiniphilum sp. TaxID=1926877 RepID=UPI002B208BAB|nr:TonB-dependent receptor [Proteiniphilum sp.]MEA5129146.1 TonB-dependent receptor [Proteiniphilum sp.]